MITKVTIPKVDANIEEGTIGTWLVPEGGAVRKGDSLVEIITDKAVFELESPASGTLRRIVAREKSVLPIGYIIGLIGAECDPLPDITGINQTLMAQYREAAGKQRKAAEVDKRNSSGSGGPAPVPSPSREPSAPHDVIRATPAARRLAREKNLDLAAIKAKTQAEVITESMVQDFA